MERTRLQQALIVFAAIAAAMLAAACSGSESPATPTAVSPSLATVVARAPFAVVVPTEFPTSADQLTQAQSDPVTPSLLHLTYVSRDETTVDGTPRATATLFMTESSGKMVQPTTGGGRLVSKDASGYELHEGSG